MSRYVVAGRYHDGSGVADEVYGPYGAERAQAVATKLNEGDWRSMRWERFPLVATPWELET